MSYDSVVSSINATLSGHVEAVEVLSRDAMRWMPEPRTSVSRVPDPEDAAHAFVARDHREDQGVFTVAYMCRCGHRSTGVHPSPIWAEGHADQGHQMHADGA